MTSISWDKLPASFFGFFLLIHVGLFFFWVYNLGSDCNLTSKFLPISIIGMIIGAVMFYYVDPYYNDIKKKKASYNNFSHYPLANHILSQPEEPTEPILNYKFFVIVVFVIYGLLISLFLLEWSAIHELANYSANSSNL